MQTSSYYQEETPDYLAIPETIQDKVEPVENDLPTIKNNCKSSSQARYIIEDRRYDCKPYLW